MKIIKMSKKAFDNADLEALLKQAKLVKGKDAYPSLLYVSEKDYNRLRKNAVRRVKKMRPGITDKATELDVGMYFLDLAPNIVKGEGLAPGHALVDDIAFQLETE